MSAAAQTPYEQYVSKGKASLEGKDYDAAEEAFRVALQERPDDYNVTLYLCIVLSRKGLKEGESLLKKALLMNPGRPEHKPSAGALLPEQIDISRGDGLFWERHRSCTRQRVFIGGSPLSQQHRRKKTKPWILDAALGMQYDSNVILGPDNQPLPAGISRKSDWSAGGYLRGQYDIVSTQNFRLTPSYTLYQSLHAKLSHFNVTDQVGGIDAVYDISDAIALKGTYTYEYVLVGIIRTISRTPSPPQWC